MAKNLNLGTESIGLPWQKPEDSRVDEIRYRPVWRGHTLVICPIQCHPFRQSVSAVMVGDRDRLFSCLKCSPIKRLLLSPELPFQELQFWAELARSVQIPVYLQRQPTSTNQASTWSWLSWWGLWLNQSLSLGIILVLSPVMLGISLVCLLKRKQIFERQWCVGRRSRLYQELRFFFGNSEIMDFFQLSAFSRLPKLINIVRGDVGFAKQGIQLSESIFKQVAKLEVIDY